MSTIDEQMVHNIGRCSKNSFHIQTLYSKDGLAVLCWSNDRHRCLRLTYVYYDKNGLCPAQWEYNIQMHGIIWGMQKLVSARVALLRSSRSISNDGLISRIDFISRIISMPFEMHPGVKIRNRGTFVRSAHNFLRRSVTYHNPGNYPAGFHQLMP